MKRIFCSDDLEYDVPRELSYGDVIRGYSQQLDRGVIRKSPIVGVIVGHDNLDGEISWHVKTLEKTYWVGSDRITRIGRIVEWKA